MRIITECGWKLEEKGSAYISFVVEFCGNGPLGKPRRRWKNIETDIAGAGFEM
jgi:hypothetical protein